MDTVRVALDRDNPPYSFLVEEEPCGFTVDVVRACEAELSLDVSFKLVRGPLEVSLALAAGSVDVATDVTVSARRLAWMAFSRHYHLEQLHLFGPQQGPLWPGFRHFTGRIAVKDGSFAQEHLLRARPRLSLLSAPDVSGQLALLDNGLAQVMAMARETGRWLVSSGRAATLREEGAPFAPAPLAFATLRDGSTDALAALDHAVERLTQSGQLLTLHERWLAS